jgi:hypothetical protein
MDRRAAVEALVELNGEIDDIVSVAQKFPFDADQPLVTLTCAHIDSILGRYLGGTLGADDVERWADAVEGRDDIQYREGHEKEIADLLFRLSGPEISGPLCPVTAQALRDELAVL